jgi:hypothetical protein
VNTTKWSVSKGSSNVLISVSLSKDKRTVSISPYSGKWTEDASYTVRGTVYSVDGASSTVNSSFTVGGSDSSSDKPGQVEGLMFATDPDYSYYAVLTWDEPKKGDVTRYNIYVKTNLDNDFAYRTYTSGTSYRFDLDDFSTSVTTIYAIVLPVNSDGVEADIEGAKAVKYNIESSDDDDL